MFENKFLDFDKARSLDRRLPDGFPNNPDTNPYQCHNQSRDGLDLCKKLNKMGISCDMSIWSKPEDFVSEEAPRHGFDQNLASRIPDGFRSNVSSTHGLGLRLLGSQDTFNPTNVFEEIMAFKNRRDLLLDHMNPPIKRSLMFEGDRALAATEGSYAADSLRARGVSLWKDAVQKGSMFEDGKRVSRALFTREVQDYSLKSCNNLAAVEGSSPKKSTSLSWNLASMVNIYGSVKLMAKDQMGCRALQKLVEEEGTFHDFKVIFREIINHVVEISMDQFGNYLVQKMINLCDEEQITLFVSVLTSKPVDLLEVCLNNYGTRVVQKMIERVKTKRQIEMVKSGLEPCCLALAKNLNGFHVIQTCLTSLGPNDNKFVLDVATKYCAEIATHRHGCCVLQCCVANTDGEQRERLVDEISRNALQLSQDPYGNYVVQYIIEQNVPAGKLLMQFRMNYAKLATQKFSSHVVEKCLKHYPESRAEIIRELTSVPNFEYLLQDPFGNYVIQTALSKTKGRVHAKLVEQVHKYGILKSSPYCKKIFSKSVFKK